MAETTKKITTAEAHAIGLRLSPRKVRLVTNLVKNMHVADALLQLQFLNKKAAEPVYKLVRSAVANAENNFKLDKELLYIKTITCDMGAKLKRYMPRAQGRASEIRRPTSHIHVVVEQRTNGKRKTLGIAQAKAKAAAVAKELAADTATGKTKEEKAPAIKNQTAKTNEQVKANKVQQKRRLFNRKSGV